MSQIPSIIPTQGRAAPVRIPSASGVMGTSSAAILAAAGPSFFDTTIGGGRGRRGSDASESSASSARIKTRLPTRGISASISDSDRDGSETSPNVSGMISQTQHPPTLALPGRAASSPPTDTPLIRQAVAFQSEQPTIININTYEAPPATQKSRRKPVFLPGQAPAGTGKKPRGRRGASSAAETREALEQAQRHGEASGQPGPTTSDGITATGRSRKQGTYDGQLMRFRVTEMNVDTTSKPSRTRKHAPGSIPNTTTVTTAPITTTTKPTPTPTAGLIDVPLKPGKGKEREMSLMNGGLNRMRLKVVPQTSFAVNAPPATNYVPSGLEGGSMQGMMNLQTQSYPGSSAGSAVASGNSANQSTPPKSAGNHYRRDYDHGAEIVDLIEQRNSETPPPPLLMPIPSADPVPAETRLPNGPPNRTPQSFQGEFEHSQRRRKAMPSHANFHSDHISPRTSSYPSISPPPVSQRLSISNPHKLQMNYSPPDSPIPDSPAELQKRGQPRTVTVYISDFRTGQLDRQLVEVKVPLVRCSTPQEGYWADANDICKNIQSSPSRVDGPAKAYTMRGTARQIILRVSSDNTDNFMHARVLVQQNLSLDLTVELLQPIGSLPLPPPRPDSLYGGRYESYNSHSDRMDINRRGYDYDHSARPRYYHRKRPSSPSFDNYDGYANRASSGRYASNKAPRNEYDWDMGSRRPPSDYYGGSPSPRRGDRDDSMDIDCSPPRRRPTSGQYRYSSHEPNYRLRDEQNPPRSHVTHRLSNRQFLARPSRSRSSSRDPSPGPEPVRRYHAAEKTNPPETQRGHRDPVIRRNCTTSPAESSAGGSSLDEADPFMSSVMKVLQQDRKLWDDFYSESTCSLPPVQHLIKKYEILQTLLKRYTPTKVPGFLSTMDEEYILQIMWRSFRSKRGRAKLMDEIKEAIELIGYYGAYGTRAEVPEVVRLVSEGDPVKTFEELAQVRKNLLAQLRQVHREWENKQKNEERGRRPSSEDQILGTARPNSSQSSASHVAGNEGVDDSSARSTESVSPN